MFKSIRFVFLLLMSGTAMSQSLRDINYNYLYSPEDVNPLNILAVRNNASWSIHFELAMPDTTARKNYVIEWGIRENLSDKENSATTSIAFPEKRMLQGSFSMPVSANTTYLVAKVIHVLQKRLPDLKEQEQRL